MLKSEKWKTKADFLPTSTDTLHYVSNTPINLRAAAVTSTYSNSIATVLYAEAAVIIAIICRRGIVKGILSWSRGH